MFVSRAAIVTSLAAPLIFVGATIIGGALVPGYDPVSQTISELAAVTNPTAMFMTIAFMLTSVCHLLTAIFTRGVGWPGRLALGAASVATFAVALFPLPSMQGTSMPHRLSAMIGFVLLAAWPVLGMRVRGHFPWSVRPIGALLGTGIMTVLCVWFLLVWSRPSWGYVGLVERMAADLEATWPAVVVLGLWFGQRRLHAGLDAMGRPEAELTPSEG